MRIVSNSEMEIIDQQAVQQVGIPGEILMECAGTEAARIISKHYLEKKYSSEILVFCGKGKNGGDGLVVARKLISYGHRVRVFLLHSENDYAKNSALNLKILKNLKAKISVVDSSQVLDEYFKSATPPFLAIDALLGTGLKRNVQGIYYDVIELINQNAAEIISLDIPSGVSGETGQIAGTSIIATITISFGYPKLGHVLSPGASRRGKLFNVDLGFPKSWSRSGDKTLLNHNNVAPLLQNRDRYGHKNSFGHSLLIGGSPGRIGAIVMASNSSLKMGTGLITVASWEECFPSLENKLSDEIMTFRIQRDSAKEGRGFSIPKPGLEAFSSVLIGPGFGMRPEAKQLLEELLLRYPGPMVIDADGLNLIAENKFHTLLTNRPAPTILTPHPGEMARILDCSKEKVIEDPIQSVRLSVEKTGSIVILKGATSLIHSADGQTLFNHYPNDGMATAGSGDVLAGMINGLLGQGMNALDATKLGVYLHSIAGKFAAAEYGHRSMTATNIIENIRFAIHDLKNHTAQSPYDSYQEVF